jgi:hypothetical protein
MRPSNPSNPASQSDRSTPRPVLVLQYARRRPLRVAGPITLLLCRISYRAGRLMRWIRGG